jgi:hypothetical protein
MNVRKAPVLFEPSSNEAAPVDAQSVAQSLPPFHDEERFDDRGDHQFVELNEDPSTTNKASAEEAEALLCIFSDQMLPLLPLLHFSPEVTARDLRSSHPFLVQAVLAVTTPTLARKQALGDRFKQNIAQAMIGQSHSTLDMLLGLLVYTAWSFDHFLSQSRSLLRYIQMAISIVFELKLNQARAEQPSEAILFPTAARPNHANSDQSTPLGTLQVERAVLACWLLSTTTAAYSGQVDAMQWTPGMEQHLTTVENKQECPSDAVLAAQIRMQLFARRLSDLQEHQEPTRSSAELLHLKAIRTDFAHYRSSLSPSLQQHHVVQLFAAYTDILISDTAYPSRYSKLVVPMNELQAIPNGLTPLVCCWSSVRSIKIFFAVFTKLPPHVVRGLAFPVWAQALRCITTLFNLSTRTDTALDVTAVRKTINLEDVLGDIALLTTSVSKFIGETHEHDLFARLSSIMEMGRDRVRVKFAAIDAEILHSQAKADNSSPATARGGMTAETLHPMEMGNELWMGNIFGLKV